MPLIIICGTPVSGKTSRAKELKDYFQNTHKKIVNIVSEDDAIIKLGYDKNSTYLDSQKEKRIRDCIKSDVIRVLGKDNVVILDGANYIKGYRYELYCASKASKSTQCTIYTIRSHQEAWKDNLLRINKDSDESNKNEIDKATESYTEEVFNALTKLRFSEKTSLSQLEYVPDMMKGLPPFTSRDLLSSASCGYIPVPPVFEEPNSNNRWDNPLFTVQPMDKLDLDAVYKVLFEKKPPPPNMSTQNPPLTSKNFVYELDKVTQSISKQILDSKQLSVYEVKFPDYPGCVLEVGFMEAINPPKLLRLRRQFQTYAKMNHSNDDMNKIGRYFIQYLNKTLIDYFCLLINLTRD